MVYAHTQFSLKLRKWWKLQCYIHATVYFRTESLWLACKGICRGVLLCAESACNQRQWFIYVIRGLRHGRSKIEKWQNSPYEVAWGLKWFWSGTHTTLWPKSASQRIFAKLANFTYLCHVSLQRPRDFTFGSIIQDSFPHKKDLGSAAQGEKEMLGNNFLLPFFSMF